jgi:hypothetical protein
MNICPKLVYLRTSSNEDSDTFPLIDDGKTAKISAIRANTPFPVSICILSCQNIKMKEPNYCGMENIHNLQADKKVCESNKTEYTSFYVDKSEEKENSPVYLLAFIRDGELVHKAGIIAEELKRTADWLNTTHNVIHCYVFCYPSTRIPLTTTRNDAFLKKKLEKTSGFIYSIKNVPFRLPRILYINAGSPYFNIIVQEA